MMRPRFACLRVVWVVSALVVAFWLWASPRPAFAQGPTRTVAVHLFEWRWEDIALECEQFLGPKGFAAVQVSPPQEHAIVTSSDGGPYPWWQRYQPVSYQLVSRSGDRQAFIDMVQRCHAAGVDVYVDAVINHMTGQESGVGSAGSTYTHYDYPNYAPWDFHYCGTPGNEIQSYSDRYQVQNCELVNLADLNTGSEYVRNTIAAYLNDLVSIGVDGFRIDAAKHIDTNDIAAILARVNGSPYIYQEVIEAAGEPITGDEYFQNGDVTEFDYSTSLGNVFLHGQLSWLSSFGEAWGFMPSDKALVFVDNHDNQRGHGGGGDVVTYKNGTLYDLANVFMLAWPYGYPRIMSSYDFSHRDQGPPSYSDGTTKPVHNPDGSLNCFGTEWKCEHRWRPIANMVEFRNVTAPAFYVSNWWTDGYNQIAFGRGNLGFVVINRDTSKWLSQTLQTGMPAGTYCDVISGERNGNSCTGNTITVNADGTASFSVPPMSAVAIHANSKVSNSVAVTFDVYATTYWGQNVYVVGNIPALGSWNTAQAVPLSASAYPHWRGTIQLPANTWVEYKYIKKDGGSVVWESGGNRTFTTPSGGSLTRTDTWR
ncbi:MAG: ATPase [Ardenticatenia bacterium]|nr:MAG: ATPase [Ardenticatenia bacterium]